MRMLDWRGRALVHIFYIAALPYRWRSILGRYRTQRYPVYTLQRFLPRWSTQACRPWLNTTLRG
jgi:hypothetical protein